MPFVCVCASVTAGEVDAQCTCHLFSSYFSISIIILFLFFICLILLYINHSPDSEYTQMLELFAPLDLTCMLILDLDFSRYLSTKIKIVGQSIRK